MNARPGTTTRRPKYPADPCYMATGVVVGVMIVIVIAWAL
jgi:hypothetical protein